MKQSDILFFLISLLFIVSGCNKTEDTLPGCEIVSPKNNTKILEGRAMRISVSTKSDHNQVVQIVLYVDGTEIAIVDAPPWEYFWQTDGFEIGKHTIEAEAIDETGFSSSDDITIEVMEYFPVTTLNDARDGNTYQLVEIGRQVWMAENLRYDHKYARYANNGEGLLEEYGYLYRTTLGGDHSVCPEDWHIPSRNDWNELIVFLGGEDVAGGKLKESGTGRWQAPNTDASNESGFSARPAGSLTWTEEPEAFGKSARFFSSAYGHYFFLNFDSGEVEKRVYHPSSEFYSIRCVRDY